MKQTLIIIAAFSFSILFFEKSIGLNLSLFSLLTVVFLIIYNPKKFKQRTILFYTASYLTTALFVFIQHSNLSIIANCAAFFTLIGAVSEHQSSIYVNWLNGLYSSVAGFFHRRLDINKGTQKNDWKKDIDIIHMSKLIGIPIVFVIMFILLYKNGNPVFNDLVNSINFNFVNFQWLLFTVLGCFLFTNISQPIQVEPATSGDLNTTNELQEPEGYSEEQLKKEKQLGTTLLGLLNLLIIFYIITDITSLVSIDTSHEPTLSSQVHNGINTLIVSIIVAISIILYFFRGNLNFYKQNKTLKQLTYIWIILNILLIILIAIKNQNYISAFGLTYKRIGVYFYISLTLIGLITTLLKVMNIKNMVFLFRTNTTIAFVILIASSTINWDHTITKYNLYTAQHFDINYLIKLSDRNAILLYDSKPLLKISQQDQYRIDNKYWAYVKNTAQSEWQEWSYDTFQIDNKDKSTKNNERSN